MIFWEENKVYKVVDLDWSNEVWDVFRNWNEREIWYGEEKKLCFIILISVLDFFW